MLELRLVDIERTEGLLFDLPCHQRTQTLIRSRFMFSLSFSFHLRAGWGKGPREVDRFDHDTHLDCFQVYCLLPAEMFLAVPVNTSTR